MLQAGRTKNAGGYRFGFQGQEADNKIGGLGQHLNYTFRNYDSWAIRFGAIDPLAGKYPYWSPFAFSGNRVIDSRELEGLEPAYSIYNKDGHVIFMSLPSDRLTHQIPQNAVIQGTGRAPFYDPAYDIILGFTPIGPALDAFDFYQSYQEGSKLGMGLAMIGFVPLGDAAKVVKPFARETIQNVTPQILKKGFAIADDFAETVARKFPLSKTNPSYNQYLAKNYQAQFSGNADVSYMFRGADFDAVVDGKLIEAKLGYANLLDKAGNLKTDGRTNGIVAQLVAKAQKHSKAITGTNLQVEWHVSSADGTKAIQGILREKGIDNIKVIHTPVAADTYKKATAEQAANK